MLYSLFCMCPPPGNCAKDVQALQQLACCCVAACSTIPSATLCSFFRANSDDMFWFSSVAGARSRDDFGGRAEGLVASAGGMDSESQQRARTQGAKVKRENVKMRIKCRRSSRWIWEMVTLIVLSTGIWQSGPD